MINAFACKGGPEAGARDLPGIPGEITYLK
jgi:hypothetical protein